MADQKGAFRAGVWIVAAIAVAAGAFAVYLSVGRDGNGGEAGLVDSQVTLAAAEANCDRTLVKADALDPYAIGQMAAMRVASRAEYLGNLSFARADGTSVTIADFAGQTLLLNLWATWCIPCREEMPALDRLATETAGEAFTVIPLHTMDPTAPPERAGEFFTEVGITTLDIYNDPNSLIFYELRRRAYTLGLPTTLLIDDNSCLLGVMQAPADWASPEAFRLVEAAIAG